MALVQVKNKDGEVYLMSAGKNESGVLGQGKEVKECKAFQKLDYDSKKTKFVDASLYDDHAMAIDQDG